MIFKITLQRSELYSTFYFTQSSQRLQRNKVFAYFVSFVALRENYPLPNISSSLSILVWSSNGNSFLKGK